MTNYLINFKSKSERRTEPDPIQVIVFSIECLFYCIYDKQIIELILDE